MNKTIVRQVAYSQYLLEIAPKYIDNITIEKDEICINAAPHHLVGLTSFLQKHHNAQFVQLVDICGVDYPGKQKRFTVIYNFLSLVFNFRIRIKTKISEMEAIPSVSQVYPSALWLERETWDLFGVFFSNHPDLRRILTDYGFEGYPFRKDFPQIGFTEVRYDDKKKHVLYEPVELAQEYRLFNFLSPWIQVR